MGPICHCWGFWVPYAINLTRIIIIIVSGFCLLGDFYAIYIQLIYKCTKQFYCIKEFTPESIRYINYFFCVKHTLILLYFINMITRKYIFCEFQGKKESDTAQWYVRARILHVYFNVYIPTVKYLVCHPAERSLTVYFTPRQE